MMHVHIMLVETAARTSVPQPIIAMYNKINDLDNYEESRSFPLATKMMTAMWTWANKTYFKGKLKPPRKIVVTEDRLPGVDADDINVDAGWDDEKRIMYFRDKSVYDDFENCVDGCLHEMCHQAVTDIDKLKEGDPDFGATGHGKAWVKWMRTVRRSNIVSYFKD